MGQLYEAFVVFGLIVLALLLAGAVMFMRHVLQGIAKDRAERDQAVATIPEVAPAPVPAPAPPHVDPTEADRTRVHEAGHTLAAWVHPDAPTIIGVAVFRNGNGLTGTLRQFPPPNPESLWHDLVTLMAGTAAELHIYGKTTPSGSVPDMMEAVHLVVMGMQLWPMDLELACPWIEQLPEKLDGIIELTDDEEEGPQEIVSWMLNASMWRAKSLMATEQGKLLALTAALRNQSDQLCEEEIEQAIGPRPN